MMDDLTKNCRYVLFMLRNGSHPRRNLPADAVRELEARGLIAEHVAGYIELTPRGRGVDPASYEADPDLLARKPTREKDSAQIKKLREKAREAIVTARTIKDAQIKKLREKAKADGDREMAKICDRVLKGGPGKAECAKAINDARAMED